MGVGNTFAKFVKRFFTLQNIGRSTDLENTDSENLKKEKQKQRN